MLKKRFTQPFRQLQGKLTISYTLTSAVTFLLIETVLITVLFLAISLNSRFFLLNTLKQDALQAAPYFVHGSADREALTAWLHLAVAGATNQNISTRPLFFAVVDIHGQTITALNDHTQPMAGSIQDQLSAQNRSNLQIVLSDVKGREGLTEQENDGAVVAIAPIVGEKGTIQGALVMKMAPLDLLQISSSFLRVIAASAVVVTAIAALIGMVSGYITARGLTRRLKELSVVADSWSRGNFSTLTRDTSEDELGQTMRHLNHMAEQMQTLLQTRQKLATLEERNRLARDLHDSVKQQVFAVGMQLGATKVLLKRDAAAAETRLNETEKLVRQAQQELTSLIRELRPVALEDKGLVAALRELTTQWTKQTNIVANLRVEDIQQLSLAVEEALYRVAQEALANVARHSNATLVQITLTTTEDTVRLSIIDNGQGFTAAQQGHLGIGLLSMRERMKALGGEAQIESIPGTGTRITACCKRQGIDTSNVLVSMQDG